MQATKLLNVMQENLIVENCSQLHSYSINLMLQIALFAQTHR